jgi:short-subunit dehydrogenase
MKKYTMITGATGGLGKAFVVECAKLGHNLFITDLSYDRLQQLANSITSTYKIDVIPWECNLKDIDDRQRMFKKIDELDIELYMTINVAGLDFEGGLDTLDSDKISTVMRVNTEATIDITRFVTQRDHNGDFYIINVASMAGFFSMPLKSIYAASKRAIIQFSYAIREEIRSKKGHLLVLCPSGMKTMPEVTASIESQGFMGEITTLETGTIVHRTIKKALRDKPKFIPGLINMMLVGVSKIVPDIIKAKLIYRRWEMTRRRVKAPIVGM